MARIENESDVWEAYDDLVEQTIAKKCNTTKEQLKRLRDDIKERGQKGQKALAEIEKIIANANTPSPKSAASHERSSETNIADVMSIRHQDTPTAPFSKSAAYCGTLSMSITFVIGLL